MMLSLNSQSSEPPRIKFWFLRDRGAVASFLLWMNFWFSRKNQEISSRYRNNNASVLHRIFWPNQTAIVFWSANHDSRFMQTPSGIMCLPVHSLLLWCTFFKVKLPIRENKHIFCFCSSAWSVHIDYVFSLWFFLRHKKNLRMIFDHWRERTPYKHFIPIINQFNLVHLSPFPPDTIRHIVDRKWVFQLVGHIVNEFILAYYLVISRHALRILKKMSSFCMRKNSQVSHIRVLNFCTELCDLAYIKTPSIRMQFTFHAIELGSQVT